MRAGHHGVVKIKARELVPGDIVEVAGTVKYNFALSSKDSSTFWQRPMSSEHGGARSGRQGAGGPAHRACHVHDAQGGPVDPDGREHHGAQALGRHRRPGRQGRQPGQEEHALLCTLPPSSPFLLVHAHAQVSLQRRTNTAAFSFLILPNPYCV